MASMMSYTSVDPLTVREPSTLVTMSSETSSLSSHISPTSASRTSSMVMMPMVPP